MWVYICPALHTNIYVQSLDLEFTVTTTPNTFELDPKSSGLVNKFVVYDSIIPDRMGDMDVSFYPAAEFIYPDESAFFAEGVGMYDEMELAFSFGNEEIGYYENTFAWDGLQVVDAQITNHISGQAFFALKSVLEKYDYPKKKIYSGSLTNTLNLIARDIKVNSYTNQTNPVKTSSNIINTGLWTRAGQTAKDFLLHHADYAYSLDNSPVFTFVNMLGELYFMTANDLIRQSPINPNNPYTLITKDNSASVLFQSPEIIQSYVIGVMASEANRPNYNKLVSSFDASNKISDSVSETIRKFLPKAQGKTSLPNSAISEPTSMPYFGFNADDSSRLYEGWLNNQFRSSAFTNKLVMIVKYNPEIAAGRNILVSLPSAKEDLDESPEYSGTYTILNSKLIHEKGLPPVNMLTVGKPRINYDRNNTFAGSFVS